MKDKLVRKLVMPAIPVLYFLWSLLLNLSGGPFSLTRSDPEYPYLLNGLNCATLDFRNIGHTDHPGTPFQVLTGLFIRITHICIGLGDIRQDVTARPDLYLSAASLMLSVITLLLMIWIGRTVLRTGGSMAGMLMIQSSVLLASVLIDLPLRYNPDRILVIYVLILSGMVIRYTTDEHPDHRKFAIGSGVLMGIGFATKFNFLPVLAVPFFLLPGIRNKAVYGVTTAAAFFIGILPILGKFGEFRKFITGVASHDGLYGQGSEQMINWKAFGHNTLELFGYNPAFTLVLAAAVILIALHYTTRIRLLQDQYLRWFLVAFLAASAIGILLVSKHFKVYYFAPVLALTGLALWFLLIRSRLESRLGKSGIYLPGAALLALILLSGFTVPREYARRSDRIKAERLTAEVYSGFSDRGHWLFIEPTWLAGPIQENALVYGISYVAHRNEFYRNYTDLYPNVLTWEGNDRKPGLFRTVEADPGTILFGGMEILVYSSPGRDAATLLNYLDTLAGRNATHLKRDTIFVNPLNQTSIIRATSAEGWHTVSDILELRRGITLEPGSPVTPSTTLDNISAGDYLEMTLQIKGNDPDNGVRLIARSSDSGADGVYFEDAGSLQDIGHGWQLLRLRGRIGAPPAGGRLECLAYYPGNRNVHIEKLTIKHMSNRVQPIQLP